LSKKYSENKFVALQLRAPQMKSSNNFEQNASQSIFSKNRISIHGVEFEEEFLAGLVVKHLSEQQSRARSRLLLT